MPITINTLPTASTSGDATICEGGASDISIDLTGTAPWNITYTDGTTPTTLTTSDNPYIFAVSEAGTYEVTSVSDANCTGAEMSGIATVEIMQKPIAEFNFDTDNLKVTFDNISQNSLTYYWDFGDNNNSTETNPIYTYSNKGTYNVLLTASNDVCGDSIYSNLIDVTVTGINLIHENLIAIYPNLDKPEKF